MTRRLGLALKRSSPCPVNTLSPSASTTPAPTPGAWCSANWMASSATEIGTRPDATTATGTVGAGHLSAAILDCRITWASSGMRRSRRPSEMLFTSTRCCRPPWSARMSACVSPARTRVRTFQPALRNMSPTIRSNATAGFRFEEDICTPSRGHKSYHGHENYQGHDNSRTSPSQACLPRTAEESRRACPHAAAAPLSPPARLRHELG